MVSCDRLCTHINRSGPLFPGHRLGGVSLGRCDKPVADEALVVCAEHVNKEALLFLVASLRRRVADLEKQLAEVAAIVEPG